MDMWHRDRVVGSPGMISRRALLASAAITPSFAASRAVAAPPAVETDIPFGEVDGVTLRVDVYRPEGQDTPRPAVVLIPGSLWYNTDRRDMYRQGRELAAAGYVAFAVETRGRPDPTSAVPGGFAWPAQLDDAQRAVRWVRANAERYGVDPERLGAYGNATGAHLATLLGLRETRDDGDAALAGYSSRVACVVDLGGPVDFALLYGEERHEAFVTAFLGGTPEEAPDAYRDASPLSWVDDDAPPFLVAQGGRDNYVELPHGRQLAAALDEAGADVVYAKFRDATNTAIINWTFVAPLVLAFLERHLHPER